MPDGVTLRTDRYRAPGRRRPARHRDAQPLRARRRSGRSRRALFAERGYQVILQSCRGTGGSGGDFDAYRHEARGRARHARLDRTAALVLREGRDCSVRATSGSCSGRSRPTRHPRCAPWPRPISSARVRAFTYPGGTFSLDSTLSWLALLAGQRRDERRGLRDQLAARRRLARAFTALPLRDADVAVTGARVPFYQDWLARMDDDAFWAPVEFDRHLELAHRAGDDGDRLVRHVPARPARGLSGAPGGRARRPSHHRPLEAHRPRRRRREPARHARLVRQAPPRSSRTAARTFAGPAVRRRCAPMARGRRVAAAGAQRPLASAPGRRAAPANPGRRRLRIGTAMTRRTRRRRSAAALLARSGGPRDNRALERRDRRPGLHQRCAGARPRGDRPDHAPICTCGPRLRAHRFLRQALRRRAVGEVAEHLRRAGPRHAGVAGGVEADGIATRRGAALARRARLPARTPDSGAGVERRAPAVRSQPRWGRTARHRGDHARRRSGGLARPRPPVGDRAPDQGRRRASERLRRGRAPAARSRPLAGFVRHRILDLASAREPARWR